MTEHEMGARLIIKNVSEDSHDLVELGIVLAPQGAIDLLDDALPAHYSSWEDVNALVTRENPSALWAAVQAGTIEVVTNTPPTEPELSR